MRYGLIAIIALFLASAGCTPPSGGGDGGIQEAKIHVPGLGWLDCGSNITRKAMRDRIKKAKEGDGWVDCGGILVKADDIDAISA